MVLANVWALCYDPVKFPEPHILKPERFLKDGKLYLPDRDPTDAIFGFGRRTCPGRHIGESMWFICAATVLALFDISKARDEKGNAVEPVCEFNSTGTIRQMADAGFFKGTSAEQDRRFADKETKLLKSMKFPPEFDKKVAVVDMRKVNLAVIRPWVAKKIVELNGIEDELVIEYAMGLLEDESQPTPDPRKMQINLTGFLTKGTPAFMSELWKLLLEAQEDVTGVPRTMVEQKKQEMRQARANDVRIMNAANAEEEVVPVVVEAGVVDGDEEDMMMTDDLGMPGGEAEVEVPVAAGEDEETRAPHLRLDGIGPLPWHPLEVRAPHPGDSVLHLDKDNYQLRALHLALHFLRDGGLLDASPIHSSRSRSPPPNRRRPRSPSFTPPIRERKFKDRKDTRVSPPRRRRGGSPNPRYRANSRSRSRSPPPRGYNPRRRSASPPPRRKSPGLRGPRRRSPSNSSISRSPSPRMRSRSGGRPPRGKGRFESRSRSRTPKFARDDKMDVDEGSRRDGGDGGIKIKGQAEVQKRRNKWDEEPSHGGSSGGSSNVSQAELEKRENELKERALRQKVMRSRKAT
ncbi:hypothetical protein NP233_g4319 [Leucocoprinus birnbaumii]|uniref:PWI domain-containing protein n=1 Tax=Leucocoprinus birnbaumii TaxID=56174 RepID=A0AAD5YVM4_9AGAR|nr:hypothetical protein NP233_g4319 [Leucocoprinus birnbaumii]